MDGHDHAGDAYWLHYESDDGLCRIACHIVQGSVWLTAPAIAALHRTTEKTVARQLKAAFCGRRLRASCVLKPPPSVNAAMADGTATRYGIDAVLLVGERLGSPHGEPFARWAAACLERCACQRSP